MKKNTVCTEDLKLGTTGDWMNCDIICIIIIKNKDVSISTGGRDKEGDWTDKAFSSRAS